ncbi:hypothetical protein APUTEX25_001933 [Auxenochlorella protothecoides]|uniref:Uncharacterized protein n=1 Tax=Auxenochlorella protothecoides TaxID=3075 RepID=A0A3M7KVH9_AUXPR|nr:hypothetical protein APUTEX25_001933 [Auxenochlorella protothecoides]|eukprot:RMZ54357.1 hypothetical protein APUTEX25_001933 [Auxenochlorella protothecoides]
MADPQREARTPLGVIHSNFAAAPAGQGTRRSKPASRGSQPGGGAGSAVAQTRIPKPTPPPQSQPRAPGTAYSVAAGPSKPHPTASQPQHTPAPSFALYDNPSFDSPHYDLRAEHSEGLTPGFLAEDAPGSSHVSEWLSSVSPLAQRTASRVDAAAPECETPLAPRQGMGRLVNAYLRTGPQMLSPEPGAGRDGAILAPSVAQERPNSGRPGAPKARREEFWAEDGTLLARSHVGEVPDKDQEASSGPSGDKPFPLRVPTSSGESDQFRAPTGHGAVSPPTFSFGGAMVAAGDGAAVLPTPAPRFAQATQAVPAGSAGSLLAPSGSVTGPALSCVGPTPGTNPFRAMLAHLRGPAYESPAYGEGAAGSVPGQGPAEAGALGSPRSPPHLTPMPLISVGGEARAAAAGHGDSTARGAQAAAEAVQATPAQEGAHLVPTTPVLGQGSVSRWLARRGLGDALGTPARGELRRLWAAAGQVQEVEARNAQLSAELEGVRAALGALGLESEAERAERIAAEEELAAAQAAAQHMVVLAARIQELFVSCEAERAQLLAQLQAQRAEHDQARLAALHAELDTTRLEGLHAGHAAGAIPATPRIKQASWDEGRGLLESSAAELAGVRAMLRGVPASPAVARQARLARTLQEVRASLAEGRAHQTPAGGGGSVVRARGTRFGPTQYIDGAQSAALARQLSLGDREEGEGPDQQVTPHTHIAAREPETALKEVFYTPFAGTPSTATTITVDYSTLCGHLAGASPEVTSRLQAMEEGRTPFSIQGTVEGATSDNPELLAVAEDIDAVCRRSPSPGSPQSSLGPSGELSPGAALAQSAEKEGAVAAAPTAASTLDADSQTEAAASVDEDQCTVFHGAFVVTNVPASRVSGVREMVRYYEALAGREEEGAAGVRHALAGEAHGRPDTPSSENVPPFAASQADAEGVQPLEGGAWEARPDADLKGLDGVLSEAAIGATPQHDFDGVEQAGAATDGTLGWDGPQELATPPGFSAADAHSPGASPHRPTPLNFLARPGGMGPVADEQGSAALRPGDQPAESITLGAVTTSTPLPTVQTHATELPGPTAALLTPSGVLDASPASIASSASLAWAHGAATPPPASLDVSPVRPVAVEAPGGAGSEAGSWSADQLPRRSVPSDGAMADSGPFVGDGAAVIHSQSTTMGGSGAGSMASVTSSDEEAVEGLAAGPVDMDPTQLGPPALQLVCGIIDGAYASGSPDVVATPAPVSLYTPGTAPRGRIATPASAFSVSSLAAKPAADVQDAVRGRLARLKADLKAAQSKLATVDQGLSAMDFTPSTAGSQASVQRPPRPVPSPLPAPSFAPDASDTNVSQPVREVQRQHPPSPAASTAASDPVAAPSDPTQHAPPPPITNPSGARGAWRGVSFQPGSTPEHSARSSASWRPATPGTALDAGAGAGEDFHAGEASSQGIRAGMGRGAGPEASPGAKAALRPRVQALPPDHSSSSSDEEGVQAVGVRRTQASPVTPAQAAGTLQPPTPASACTSAFEFSPLLAPPRGRHVGLPPRPRRLPTASEDREFRRRAAALNIHVSPYFR